MIPQNAAEATDLLRCRRREVDTARRQVDHYGALQDNARERLAQLEAEVGRIVAMFPDATPAPSPLQTGEGA